MAVKVRFLLCRDGRFYARKVVPLYLRAVLSKTELRVPLGPDRRTAIAQLPAALVMIDAILQEAARPVGGRRDTAVGAATPMDTATLARTHYSQRLMQDAAARNLGPLWASIGINDEYVAALRAVLAGRLRDEHVEALLGEPMREFEQRGLLAAQRRSPEWREAARAIADAELHALERAMERDEGVSPNSQHHPPHLVLHEVNEEPEQRPYVSLRGLLEAHILSLESEGRGRTARSAWPRIFDHLIAFVGKRRGRPSKGAGGPDDANALLAEELIDWRDGLLKSLDAKTVKDGWMAAVKAVLQHAVEDRKIRENPARDVKVRMARKVRTRDPGYSDEEARRILTACRAYAPMDRANAATKESPHVSAAKRWGPWLCAFTGARVTEVLQLRKEDIQSKGGTVFLRITPEAGTVKDRRFREVPLHQQLIDLGFLEFVVQCADGPLFYSLRANPAKLPARAVAGRLSTWLRKEGLAPVGVAPNHGWRHRFKSTAIDLGINPRVYDAIQGHAGRSASDSYGEVSLKAKSAAIRQFPHYQVEMAIAR